MDYGSEGYLDTQAQPGMNMPFSLEAEQSVLGAILLEPSCLATVVDILPRKEYFYAGEQPDDLRRHGGNVRIGSAGGFYHCVGAPEGRKGL